MSRLVNVLNVGRLTYSQGLTLQKYVAENVKSKQLNDTLILLEHDPVYTVGIREKLYSKDEENKLKELGAEFYRTNRGGLITFHGPGQLVAYPILYLKNYEPSVRWYVCQLEQMIIKLCLHYNIEAETSPHTGVWVKDAKICALGIHVCSYITSHGLALNCNTNLTWFKHITPCGIIGKTVTSLTQEINKETNIQQVTPVLLQYFSQQFNCQLQDMNTTEVSDIISNVQNIVR